ncbi:chain dehydrogenase/reductase [Anaeramoeba flamelloides]|uniref:Chain dehydrogenase/reductase n=1 Tax=Anaeramoeba flamelloides TaxID=1746091 RepID=A0ABQ8YXV4_9EUKA|nr:chain dehydrogenase/reductase [Anaeramoeba flamelloides]
MENKKIALVTGAQRGIGLEVCKQLAEKEGIHVILSALDLEKGQEAVKQLKKKYSLDLSCMQMDVSNLKSVQLCRDQVLEKFGRLDILVNNAGVHLDQRKSILEIDESVMEKTFSVNFFGDFYTMKTFLPIMQKNDYGRIVNVSSTRGTFSQTCSDIAGCYKLSKYSQNALTRTFASAVTSKNIKINAVCPGWVKTKMGGNSAPVKPSKAIGTIIYLAMLPKKGPTGKFFSGMREMNW